MVVGYSCEPDAKIKKLKKNNNKYEPEVRCYNSSEYKDNKGKKDLDRIFVKNSKGNRLEKVDRYNFCIFTNTEPK